MLSTIHQSIKCSDLKGLQAPIRISLQFCTNVDTVRSERISNVFESPKSFKAFSNYVSAKKRIKTLLVVVWRPLKHIAGRSSKTVHDKDNAFRGNMSDYARIILRWHSHSAMVNDKACRSASLCVHDRPTDQPAEGFFSLCSYNFRMFWSISVIQKHF